MNKVFLIGNLGKDPEFRAFENGGRVTRFPLATNESYTNRQGERVNLTEWHDIEVWERQAEIADKYLRKGSKVMIEGRIRTENWTDKNTNEPRQRKTIRCTSFEILSGHIDNQVNSEGHTNHEQIPPQAPSPNPLDTTGDLPF